MSEDQATKQKMAKAKFPKSFGVFSPTGYVVMALGSDSGAQKARESFLQNGFKDADVTQYTKDEVLAALEGSEEPAVEPFQIGQEVAKIDEYIEFAKQGCGFLIVHAPKDEDAKRAVRLAKPFDLKFAEKYNRLTMEELA